MRAWITGALFCTAVLAGAGAAQAEVRVHVTYLRHEAPPRVVLSNLDPVPADLGLAGAQLGRLENATTGRFLNQSFTLDILSIPAQEDILVPARIALARGDILLLDMAASDQTAIADLDPTTLMFNVSDSGDALRGAQCRANILHSALSARMESDALMQVLLSKRWTRLALMAGPRPDDHSLAQLYRDSARKFGLKIVDEVAWTFDTDLRRAANTEVALLTQGLKAHDVLLVADAADDFARYIPFNTWDPRPVAGRAGLSAQGWSPAMEQWGAAQLQARFEDLAGRDMAPRDYAAYAAMRSIGEAVARIQTSDQGRIRDYILSPDFELAAFQGRPLSYRPWDGQMRQPVPVATTRALVASAPLDGFEHARNPLDSLGVDAPETLCTAFKD
ncbi:hypothetical protein AQS8620_00732 [Aquimixticola soesokkakensis]|uniref:Uncharacterized protein n=1 Tax=Aquimixticola soesokkakensis TaxID=1519096 RepID=A0A1Y5RUE2_9RHOB|nr:ABC transporter substrate-binding protein [Aquimixticola soesokkakensis]SLN25340.1 hypothetical protein AQS8620_00732 [Aquimixticola soesokkakensis]